MRDAENQVTISRVAEVPDRSFLTVAIQTAAARVDAKWQVRS